MADPNWDEKAVFLHALGLSAEKQEKYLEEACPNATSKERIHTLLRHHNQASDDLLTVAAESSPSQLDPAQIDEFKIIRRIGAGGMGVVYLAEDTILGRRVALKVITRQMTGSERAIARFRDEARNAAALKHPAIVPVFKFGRDGDDHYLVTEFVNGQTLAELITERRGTASSPGAQGIREWHWRAAEIVAAVADALDCAHRARIVHRDVKPSNVLIDPEHGPRLADFGIAKHMTEESRTEQTELIGSCHYMSPEQASIAGTRIDERSDIFSLGVVLYEMLSLRLPFDGPTLPQVLKAVVECSPARLRSVDKRIPRDLETICHKAIEKDPRHRYQTAAHVAADLRCFLTGDPILARPPGVGRRTVAFLTRRRAPLTAVLTVCAVLLAILYNGSAVKEAKDDNLAWVKLDTGSEACRAFLQRMDSDPNTTETEFRDLGLTPIPVQRLDVGQYRLTVVRPTDGAFCEFNLAMKDRGPSNQRTLVLNDGHSRYPAGASTELVQELGMLLVGVLHLPEADPEGMLRIEGGKYALARGFTVDPLTPGPTLVEEFYIDAGRVTNREYKEFLDITGYRRPNFWMEDDPASILDLPITGISFEEAEAYARWRGKRLPTLAEWQAAARGRNGDLYPGGDEPPDIPEPSLEIQTEVNSNRGSVLRLLYIKHALPTSAPDAFQAPGRPAHMFDNVHDLSGTISLEDSSVYFCGRAWYEPVKFHDLGRVDQTLMAFPSPFTGLRCARSKSVGATRKPSQ